MIFDAETLARGWLSVAVASANDKDMPQLHRTLSIEAYPEGVRLVATDSYVLLRSFVPAVESDALDEPPVDEVPVATAVAMDPHGRGVGFLAHLLKLTRTKGALPREVRLDLGVVEPEDDRPTLGGMECAWVVIEEPDVERIKLRTYEGAYPNWRSMLGRFEGEETKAVALNPLVLGRLAKLGKLHGDGAILWRFGGADRMALLDVAHAEPYVTGAVMPVRWDFDRDAPRTTPGAADDEAEGEG